MPDAGAIDVADMHDSAKTSSAGPELDVAAAVPGKGAGDDGRLPVKAGLRCAILVNDMAELNVDANLVRDGGVVQVEEEMVEMQNGCICCTLRADLVIEVAKLAKQNKFDYLIIESTGISEPMQVAETFTMPVPIETVVESMVALASKETDGVVANEKDPNPSEPLTNDNESTKANTKDMLLSLANLARLDTCVTVIDAVNFDQTMESVMTVREGEYSRRRRGEALGQPVVEVEVPEEDDRTLADLMVDQIEFADVIIINKVDLAVPKQINHIKAVVKMLNPSAELLTAVNCAVPLSKVVGTGLFDMEKAEEMESWQRDVADIQAGIAPTPETEEYDVGSFVFKALRPFHPQRLYKFVDEHFLMTVEYDAPEEEEGESANGEDGNEADANADEGDGESVDEGEEMIRIEDRRKQQDEMKKRGKADFGGTLLRSKGVAYLASSRYFPIVWSHAGSFLTLSQQMPWFSETADAEPEENEEDAPEGKNAPADSDGGTQDDEEGKYPMHGLDPSFVLGDKATELVLIGHEIDKAKLRKCLEDCLLTDEEIAQFGAPTADQGGWCDMECPFSFPIYLSPPIVQMEEEDEEDDE